LYKQAPISMSMLPSGSRCVVRGIVAGRGLIKRLVELGLEPGSTVKVVRNERGPLLIEIKGSRLALSRGIASKVLVEVS